MLYGLNQTQEIEEIFYVILYAQVLSLSECLHAFGWKKLHFSPQPFSLVLALEGGGQKLSKIDSL